MQLSEPTFHPSFPDDVGYGDLLALLKKLMPKFSDEEQWSTRPTVLITAAGKSHVCKLARRQ
jgi:hypothetical protein